MKDRIDAILRKAGESLGRSAPDSTGMERDIQALDTDLERYVRGELSERETEALERVLADDDFARARLRWIADGGPASVTDRARSLLAPPRRTSGRVVGLGLSVLGAALTAAVLLWWL